MKTILFPLSLLGCAAIFAAEVPKPEPALVYNDSANAARVVQYGQPFRNGTGQK